MAIKKYYQISLNNKDFGHMNNVDNVRKKLNELTKNKTPTLVNTIIRKTEEDYNDYGYGNYVIPLGVNKLELTINNTIKWR